jgi:hypothetical protein
LFFRYFHFKLTFGSIKELGNASMVVLNAPIAIDIELVFNVFLIVIDLDDVFDFEHTNQQVFEEPDLDLLLDDDERSVL